MFDNYTNRYARWIWVIAVLCIVFGIIAAIVLGFIGGEKSIGPALYGLFYAVAAGVFMFGFAEIVEIQYRMLQRVDTVDEIKRLLDRMNQQQ